MRPYLLRLLAASALVLPVSLWATQVVIDTSTAIEPNHARDTIVVRVVDDRPALEFLLALVAVLAAAGGTLFAGRQARLARQALVASTTPAVTCIADMRGSNEFGPGIQLHNSGAGVAKVVSFQIKVDGNPMSGRDKGGWVGAFSLLGLQDSEWRKEWWCPGDVIAPGEKAGVLVYLGTDWQDRQAELRRALRRISLDIHYVSVVGEAGSHAFAAEGVIHVPQDSAPKSSAAL